MVWFSIEVKKNKKCCIFEIMKVLQTPNKIYECNRCGAKITLDKSDHIYYGGIGTVDLFLPGLTRTVWSHYVYCPFCGDKIIINKD